MQDCKVDILGAEYSIFFVDKFPDDKKEYEDTATGLCNAFDREIHIKRMEDTDCSEEGRERLRKNVLCHEIIHAFLNESGLGENANNYFGSWSQNEEMVDWLAIQFPKILKVFKEVGCI